MAKTRVTKAQMTIICERIAEGTSLTRICNEDSSLPSWRTVLRWVQENEEAYTQLAMAEVQRRRLEADHKDKHIRQMQPLGIRDKAEDNKQSSGTITLSWGNAEVATQ